MIKFLTILSIFIVLLNEIDAKSLDRPSKVPQRDGYEPPKDRTMNDEPNPTGSKPPMDREIGEPTREPTKGGSGAPKDRKIKEPSQGGNAPWGNNCWTKPC